MTDRIKFADGRPDEFVEEPVKIRVIEAGVILYRLTGPMPRPFSMKFPDEEQLAFYPMRYIESITAEPADRFKKP